MENAMNELSRDARRLIDDVADNDGPNAVRRARVKQKLAARLAASGVILSAGKLAAAAGGQAGGAAGTLLSAAAVGKAGVSVGSVALWLAGGALVGTLTMTPLVMRSGPSSVPSVPTLAAAPAAKAARAQTGTPSLAVRTLPAEPADTPEPERPEERERAPNRENVAAPARGVTAAESTRASERAPANLGAETELLESAQRELAAGQGERALQLLEHHEQRFPSAALSEERTFARVIALCQLGRSADARAAAETFLRAAPRSPLVPRLLKSCAFSERPAR
jgi:hypothetical protein